MYRSPASKAKLKEAVKNLKQALNREEDEERTFVEENLSPTKTNRDFL